MTIASGGRTPNICCMNSLNRSWLRAVRISALCIFLATFVPFVAQLLMKRSALNPEDADAPLGLFLSFFLSLWLPYLWVFWRLRDIHNAKRIKQALAQVVSWGSFHALLVSPTAVYSWLAKSWLAAVLMSIFVLIVFTLIISAIKTYYSMDCEPGDRTILAVRFGVVALYLLALATIIPNSSFFNRKSQEASAVTSLRTINAAQVEYAKTYPDKGFASSLAELGPARGAALINQELANGRRYNYTFTLNSSLPGSSGHVTKYTLSARPNPYGSLGQRSFLTDESGTIHYTAAARAPTVHDPVLY